MPFPSRFKDAGRHIPLDPHEYHLRAARITTDFDDTILTSLFYHSLSRFEPKNKVSCAHFEKIIAALAG